MATAQMSCDPTTTSEDSPARHPLLRHLVPLPPRQLPRLPESASPPHQITRSLTVSRLLPSTLFLCICHCVLFTSFR